MKKSHQMKEIWKDIKEYKNIYKISSYGRFASNHKGKWKILKCGYNGLYKGVNLYKNGIHNKQTIHRLVAIYFIPNPQNKPQINHINGIKEDNRIENLEWVTQSENMKHSFHILGNNFIPSQKGKFGKKHWRSNPIIQFDLDWNVIKVHESINIAARELNTSAGNIHSALSGKRKKAGGFNWGRKRVDNLTTEKITV